jgi:hypothetical protein
VYACTEVRVAGNAMSRIGHPAAAAGNAYGILAAAWQDTVSVSDNTVLSGAGPSPVIRPGWTALSLAGMAVHRMGAVRSVDTARGKWTFLGDVAYLQRETVAHVALSGNSLQGGADDVAIVVSTGGNVIMTANRCVQPGTAEQQVVRIAAGVAIVQGNRLVGGDPSMTMAVNPDAATVIGNITSGGIQINGTMVDNTNKPWSSLNPVA